MKQTELVMGMPITIEVLDRNAGKINISHVFNYFRYVDKTFSVYKPASEISQINKGALSEKNYSEDMKTVLRLCRQTKNETQGYFDILYNGRLDPSGLVKGWAIQNAVKMLKEQGFKNFYINAGGDIQASGRNKKGNKWTVGIRSPFNRNQIVKVLNIENEGVATSGTYIRGKHIYNPHKDNDGSSDIASLTVVGLNIYEADRFATAAFAMGKEGIYFIESVPGLEGYLIDKAGKATYTSSFDKYIASKT